MSVSRYPATLRLIGPHAMTPARTTTPASPPFETDPSTGVATRNALLDRCNRKPNALVDRWNGHGRNSSSGRNHNGRKLNRNRA